MTRSRVLAVVAVAVVLSAISVLASPAGRGFGHGPTLADRSATGSGSAGAGEESTAIPPSARASAASGGATFGQPTVVGIQGVGFEEDIRVDTRPNSDAIYTSAPGALSSGTSWVWRSLDHGKTFKWIPAATAHTGKLPTCVGGGDTELAVDSTGSLYFNDLTLANFSTFRSDDQGQTLLAGDCAAVTTTPNDRQWYATDGDPKNGGTLYLVSNIIGAGAPQCGSSAGNNELVMTRSPADPALGQATAGNNFAPSQFVTAPASCDEGIMGNDEVSPTTHHIFVIHDDAYFHKLLMGRCVAVPFTTDPTGLQCTDHLINDIGSNQRTGGSFPTMAIDAAGTLYAVWEQAPVNADNQVIGDTVLHWSSSSDEGNTWTTPVKIPTPGLHNNVFAWPVAGDAGRVDIAWYGTPAVAGPPVFNQDCNNEIGATESGPDIVNGLWSLYFTQTLNGTAATPTFSTPLVASQHFVQKGSINTVMGGQCGNRTLGDFLQMRMGLKGEANISYGQSLNRFNLANSQAMFVRQIGGPSLLTSVGIVTGSKAPTQTVTDTAGDARYENAGQISANQKNLDILSSAIIAPDADHYQITMRVADLTSLAPDPATGNSDPVLVWQTQWTAPGATNANGGENWFVYMESNGGGAPTFWTGVAEIQFQGGGAQRTYPGVTQVPGSYTATAPGTITITVPKTAVTLPEPALNTTLYQVTASTETYPSAAENPPPVVDVGGQFTQVIDVAPGYNFKPSTRTPSCTIKGTSGNDLLVGTDGNDVICGYAGNDTIQGKGGNDVILGDKGGDTITGGAGNDNLRGGYGADSLDSRDTVTGNDKMDGGRDTDTCMGDSGDTKVDCEH